MTLIHKDAPAQQGLQTFKAPQGTGYSEPSTFTLVRADSPAMCVMTDFKQVSVATIAPDATLAQANQTMISRGVRLLLVVNRDDAVLGLITSRDTSGEKPIQLIQERGGKFTDLLVSDLMCPRDQIDLIDSRDVLTAKVADIVVTLKALHRQHALVGERDPIGGKVRIRGIFSATQIGRQLGAAIQTFDVGSTFTEIEGLLAQDNV
ncbi:MAG: CBS domain-containing protein [Rhodocyclaceae bacterium]|jgi:CBS domain-containing protein|nr:CBS domain-containing protein [Rhodocyclaceae bacterium]